MPAAMVVREVHGTVTPGRIARVALERYDDRDLARRDWHRGSLRCIGITSARPTGWHESLLDLAPSGACTVRS